jgi:hypothetical protein
MARDVTGVRQCEHRIRMLAARSPHWMPYLRLAEGYSALCSDDLDAARGAFEAAVELTATSPERPFPLPSAWCISVGGQVETLVALGDFHGARRTGESALALCNERGIGAAAYGISRALAVAEANVGALDAARARIDAVISGQRELGVTGLHLGATYEAGARVALAAGDREEFTRYAALASQEYRHGKGSALGARFQRLVLDGARLAPDTTSSSAQWAAVSSSRITSRAVGEILKTTRGANERAECALRLLCEAANVVSGHLYLLDGHDVRHAASRPRQAPPEGLSEFLRGIDARAGVDDGATVVIDDRLETQEDRTIFVDDAGACYQAVPLLGSTSEGLRHVATAALLLVEGARAIDQDLTLTIGTHLFEPS